MEGLASLRREEEAFSLAHGRSSKELRDSLAGLRAQYEEEVKRVAAQEARRQAARQKQLQVLQRRSESLGLVGSQLLEAQLESEGAPL